MSKALIIAFCLIFFISAVSALTIAPAETHLTSDAAEDAANYKVWAKTINDAAEDKKSNGNGKDGKEDVADAKAWHTRWWDMVEDRNMASPEDKKTIQHWIDFREDGKGKDWAKAKAAAGPL